MILICRRNKTNLAQPALRDISPTVDEKTRYTDALGLQYTRWVVAPWIASREIYTVRPPSVLYTSEGQTVHCCFA